MKSKSFLSFAVGFVFGVGLTLAAFKIKSWFFPSNAFVAGAFQNDPLAHESDDDFFEDGSDPQSAMLKQMRQLSRGSGVHLNLQMQGLSDIESREDDKNYYFEIKGEKGKLKDIQVQVEQGMLHIQGKFESKSTGSVFQSNVVSSFERSFPVPEGADEKGMQMDQLEDKIVIRIPKKK